MSFAVPVRIRTLAAVLALSLTAVPCFGGGVRAVAGGAFDPSVHGQPLRWAAGALHYYTDQGKLGSLTQTEADTLVAEAFARWTAVPTAAISATRDGTLDEDVSGINVSLSHGEVVFPADVQPSAVNKPIAFVYDDDGAVIDTLLGVGASDPNFCLTHGVIGGPDAHDTFAHYQHALIVINGRCLSSTADLLRMRYLLVRAIGATLGLGWSQVNDNVATGSPAPTLLDLAGVPVMHPIALLCGPAFPNCVTDADQLRMDDRAAISALYPVDAENIAAFTGKQLFSTETARIWGSLRFVKPNGTPGQPVQGVNAIARRVDPQTGIPSRAAARSSVSGFLFRGNAGNRATGTLDPLGAPYTDFGSDDPQFEGYFDLSGLELPEGANEATYQIEFETTNPLYIGAQGVGPYKDAAVVPPAGLTPIMVGVTRGGSVERTLPVGVALIPQDRLEPSSWDASRPVVSSGEWIGSISGYGDEDFFQFSARAGRTFSVLATAIDATGNVNTNKLLPVIGVWPATAQSDASPLLAAGPFNGITPGATILQASTNSTAPLKFGIMDLRGDGRPDFLYKARLLYADSVTPAQLPPDQASRILIAGIGFSSGMTVSVGGVVATILSMRANEIAVLAPGLSQGIYEVRVEDPANGATATIAQGLRYGAANDDGITDLSIGNLTIPVGMTAPNPIRVRVTSAGGQPISGAQVTFTITPTQSQLSCGSNICALLTDANGEASVSATINVAGSNGVTAAIGNGASITRGITGSSTGAQLLALTPMAFVPAGAPLSLPLTFRYAVNGSAQAGIDLIAGVAGAGASLTSGSPVTDGTGSATTTLNVGNPSGTINVTACVTATSACAQVSVLPQPIGNLQIVPVTPLVQRTMVGEPVAVRFRVTGGAPNYVLITNAKLNYSVVVSTEMPSRSCSEGSACASGGSRILANATGTLISDALGEVDLHPSLDPAWGAVQISIEVALASGAQQTAKVVVVPAQ